MIPTKADTATHERYVANIIAAWHNSTESDRERGRCWYPVAHDIAEEIGDGDVRKGAGVLAALSPQKSWDANVALATDACNGNAHGHIADALRKVGEILAGSDPVDVLPQHAKTWHFYRNILDPTDPDPITIDRHAHDIAVGEVYGSANRGLNNATRYATLAHAYREAARRLNVLPNVLQATTWVAHRRALRNN